MLRQVLRLARATVGDPQSGVKAVLGLQFGRLHAVMAAVLVALLGVLLAAFESLFLPRAATSMFAAGLSSPLGAAALQLAVMATMVFLIHFGGRMFGGVGRFTDAIMTVAWLQFLNFLVQAFGFFLMLFLGLPFVVILVVSAVISTWMLVNFVAALHGFLSTAKVFGVIMGLYVSVSIVIGIVLDMFGYVPGSV